MVDEEREVESSETEDNKKPEVSPERKALVKQWIDKIEKAEAHYEKGAFERARKCMALARDGKADNWADEKFAVPVLTRHINQAVAQLYAKNPTAEIKRRKRLLTTVWDGDPNTAMAAFQAFQAGDVTQLPVLQEVLAVKEYFEQNNRMADTLTILWDHFTGEQEASFKDQLKALVRRAKVCGAAYVTLDFQRLTGESPELTARIDDARSKIQALEDAVKDLQENEVDEESAEVEQTRLLLKDLQQQAELVLREGPVFGFPKMTKIIIDPKCVHLKTLAGACWYAQRFDLTKEDIEETYGVDVGNCKPKKQTKSEDGRKQAADKFAVYEVWDKKLRQRMVVACGYEDFIEEPAEPFVQIEGFFNLFPIVFNEVESEEPGDIIPPSDVWYARHSQNEINRSRESLRQHRIANRPWYAAAKGALQEQDQNKLANHADHEIVELASLQPGAKVDDLLQRGASVPIDPAQYNTSEHFQDVLRAVGSQEANLGPTSGATATESSIAETSRMSGLADQIDEIDGLLSRLAKATGHLMLLNLREETVKEIVGPGAAWPVVQTTREEIAKDLVLDIQANSTGKPNEAAELANLERAMPFLLQMPGVNMAPIVKKFSKLLDVDMEDMAIEGLPSTVALNQMIGDAIKQQTSGVPAAQGPQGAQNEEAAPAPDGTSQPEYTAPGTGQDLQG